MPDGRCAGKSRRQRHCQTTSCESSRTVLHVRTMLLNYKHTDCETMDALVCTTWLRLERISIETLASFFTMHRKHLCWTTMCFIALLVIARPHTRPGRGKFLAPFASGLGAGIERDGDRRQGAINVFGSVYCFVCCFALPMTLDIRPYAHCHPF